MGRSTLLEKYLLILLFAFAVTLTIAIVLHLFAFSSEYIAIQSLQSVGNFLFSRFHLVAFLIAAYPLFAAALFLMERSPRALFFELLLAIVPLLFFSVAIHLLVESSASYSPLITGIRAIFGKNGGIIVMSLLTAGIFLGIVQLGDYLRNGNRYSNGESLALSTRQKNNAVQELYRTPNVPQRVTEAEPQDQPRVQETVTESLPPHRSLYTEPSLEDHQVSPQSDFSNEDEKDRQYIANHDEPTLYLQQNQPAEPPVRHTFFLSSGEITSQRPSKKISPPTSESGIRDFPPVNSTSMPILSHSKKLNWKLDANQLLNHYPQMEQREMHKRSRLVAEKLRSMLQEFNIEAKIVGIRIGPVVTVYEVLPAPGVKVTRVSSLSDNIALRLAAPRVRIEAPIPGKQAIGIEIPNTQRQIVGFDQLVTSKQFRDPTHVLPIALGKNISGEPYVIELAEAPHLLIAGATGSGKSVCVNSIICSLIFHCPPARIRMMLIDTKIVELKLYNDIPHLLTPVITDPRRALQALEYCVREMEQRYSLLNELSVRDISAYNRRAKSSPPLPYIVVIIDELADLMATAGKKIEALLVRLAAMSRAVGIHLVLATQRPSADVITGLIKANIPSRISFMVSSKIDARIVLDVSGAEQLLGKGDMLYVSARHPHPLRIQGTLVTDEEVLRIVQVAKEYAPPEYVEEHKLFGGDEYDGEGDPNEDHLFEEAVDIVRSSGRASASFLQRRLQIGYNRAARLIEEMERQGIVGSANGSKPREVIKVH